MKFLCFLGIVEKKKTKYVKELTGLHKVSKHLKYLKLTQKAQFK